MLFSKEKVTPFITLPGTVEQALTFYQMTFSNFIVESLIHYPPNSQGIAGSVLNATVTLANQRLLFMDMDPQYYQPLANSFSLLYACDSLEQFMAIFTPLADSGEVLMGPEALDTGNVTLQQVAWVTDRFGLTWQLVVQ